jgi:hypothetical protein
LVNVLLHDAGVFWWGIQKGRKMKTQTDSACSVARQKSLGAVTWLAITILCGFGIPEIEAKPKPAPTISAVPTITSVGVQDGQLVASGNISANIKGQTYTAPFSNVPVDLSLAADQTAAGACPILDLSLGPITLDLLGLVVETSPICLQLTAVDGGGLLGDLLCSVANLLNGGLSLDQILGGQGLVDVTGTTILPGLTTTQVEGLLGGVQTLLNGALGNLLDAILNLITEIDANRTCSILHLELGPLDLNLLGLEVILDDCSGGPVVVDITAQTGRGKLLGNLLCELLDGGSLNLGTTLGNLLNQILGLLTN